MKFKHIYLVFVYVCICVDVHAFDTRVHTHQFDYKNYTTQLSAALAEGYQAFRNNVFSKNSVVIFDVDDTSLDTTAPTGKIMKLFDGYCVRFFKPISQVLKFYKNLIALGFNVIFLTARVERPLMLKDNMGVCEATKKNLIDAGYTQYLEVVCRTPKDYKTMSIAAWKEMLRKQFASRYTIIATLDDDPKNLNGMCTGKKISIPRNASGIFYLGVSQVVSKQETVKIQ